MYKGVFTGFATVVLTVLSQGLMADQDSMAVGLNGFTVSPPLLTVGETLYYTSGALNPTTQGAYTPPGIMDGLGAYKLNSSTARVFVNHELLNSRGYPYEVSNGQGGTFTMTGARVSYFDIDKYTKDIIDAGIAYHTIYDANGNVAQDISFLPEPYAPFFGGPDSANQQPGFSRFCSSQLVEAGLFDRGNGYGRRYQRGLEDTIYFTGEEDGTGFNSVGGAEWALDVTTGNLWAVPAMGRGGWENITPIDTKRRRTVAFLLADDSEPFNFDDDAELEAAPLFLYIGRKYANGNFLQRNGLSDGKLYTWVADSGVTSPADFNGSGTLWGRWVEIDNSPTGTPSQNGETGFDEYGYPTQGTLWNRAEAVGAFGFSRPEDLATNPHNGSEAVLASTGVDTYEIDPVSGNGFDTFGTIYTVDTNFRTLRSKLTIIYDGDADPSRALRSPDNLDWSANGMIYIQEDEAEEDTASGDEVLFGPGAINPNEAGIVELNPWTGAVTRIANVNREVILDASIAVQTDAVDVDAGDAGEWETSGILDVSALFGEKPGALFLFDVQAHGVEDQEEINPASRISDGDLSEGGQLLFLINDELVEDPYKYYSNHK